MVKSSWCSGVGYTAACGTEVRGFDSLAKKIQCVKALNAPCLPLMFILL